MAVIKLEQLHKHIGQGLSYTAKASLNRNGMLSLNDAAIRRYALKDVEAVVLYYDPEQELVVIEPSELRDEGAMKLRKRETGGYVAAGSFIGNFQIEIAQTTTYPLRQDKDSGFLYFELGEGKERKSGKG